MSSLHVSPCLPYLFPPGRYVVDLLRLCRFPVFWGYAGQGDGVRRGVWMHESKQGYLIPYPPR